MAALQNNKFQIEALILHGYFRKAIRVLLPELAREPENPDLYLQALVAASEDYRPGLLNWLAGKRENFQSSLYLIHTSRALTPGIMADKSIKLLNQAIDLCPENAHLFFLRAKRLRGMGLLRLAVSDFSNVIALNPGYMIAYQMRATSYQELGLFGLAIRDYKEFQNSYCINRNRVDHLINQCFAAARRRERQLKSLGRIQQAV